MSNKKPPLFLNLTEGARATLEFWQSKSFRASYEPPAKGDGHPILVIPGFLTTDFSTVALRKFLYRMGYQTHGWGIGRNLAKMQDLDALSEKVTTLYHENQSKITLLGWSLGGVYARELAKLHPDKIRQVITLASPFRDLLRPTYATKFYHFLKFFDPTPVDEDFLKSLAEPAPVPTTCFYSKKDGVVHWDTCLEKKEDALHKNIEVACSHLGMGNDKEVLERMVHEMLHVQAQKQSV